MYVLVAMLSLVNIQIFTTAKHIVRRVLNDTSVSPNAEGDSQQPHENGEGNTELHACSGCVTDIEGSLRKYQLRNGSEETIIGRDHLANLDVNLLRSRIKMLLTNLTEVVTGMSTETAMPRIGFIQYHDQPCPGHHCANCEPECLLRFA
jgi:hypothetical protein